MIIATWLMAWELTARSDMLPTALIGQPSVFLLKFFLHLTDGTFLSATAITFYAVFAAFFLGSTLALSTALLLTVYPILEKLLSPIIEILNALPRVALIPLFILWLGLGIAQKVASGVSIMFFVLLSYTLAGAKSANPDQLLLAKSLGMSRSTIFWQIIIPSATPAIFAGLRLGMIYTVLGVITAELIAGGRGMGTLVSYYSNTFDPNGVFASLLMLVLLTSILGMIMSKVEKRVLRWQERE